MPTFKAVFLPDSVVLTTSISDDKKNVSIMVDNLFVALPAREKPTPPSQIAVGKTLADSPLVAYRLGNLFVALKGDEPAVRVKVDIRGGVDTGAGSRAVLISRLAGVTYTDELAEGEKSEPYTLTHSLDVTPSSGFAAMLLLLIDRDFVDGALPFASASVETIDLTFESPAAPKEG